MSTLADLETDVKAFAFDLGAVVAPSWADRDVAFGGLRAFVHVTWSEQLELGANRTQRLAEVEVTFANRVTAGSYQSSVTSMLGLLSLATVVESWAALGSVRSSPRPEIEAGDKVEKVGQVLTFKVRALVALEG